MNCINNLPTHTHTHTEWFKGYDINDRVYCRERERDTHTHTHTHTQNDWLYIKDINNINMILEKVIIVH